MKRSVVWLFAFLLTLTGIIQAQQNCISVSFRHYDAGWDYHDNLRTPESQVAGYVPVAYWNQVLRAENGTTYGSLVDSLNNPTSVNFTVNRDYEYYNVYLNIDSGTEGLLTDWEKNTIRVNYSNIGCNSGSENRPLVSVNNIPFKRYNMIVYLTNDAHSRNASITAGGTTYYYQTEWLGDGWNDGANQVPLQTITYNGQTDYISMKTRMYKAHLDEDESIWHIASVTTEGDYSQYANVAIFEGLSDPTMQIIISCQASAGIAGFQIVDATTVSDPDPANDAVDVPVNTNLSWTAPTGYAPSQYNLYLSTDPNNINLFTDGTLTDTAFDPTNNLDFYTTYYWQIGSVDPNDGNPFEYRGPVWSFTTAPELPVIDAATPFDLLVAAGEMAEFTANATNPSTGDETDIQYNWFKVNPVGDDEALGSGKVLTIENVAIENEGSYYFEAVIGATGASATSDVAWLNTERMLCNWKFDGDLTDSVAGFDGTPVGSEPNYVEGVLGQALNLTSFSSPITLPTDAYTSFSWTLSLWEKASATEGEWQSFIASGADAGYENLELNRHGADQYAHGVHGSYSYPVGNAPREEWQHVVVSFNGETKSWRWYLNGVDVSGGAGVSYNGFDTVFYVGDVRGGGQKYTGAVDDIRFFNYALNAYEAAALYTEVATDEVICVEAVAFDLNQDCKVDVEDLSLLISSWMNCNIVPDCR